MVIRPEDIELTEVKQLDGSLEYRALVELRAYHRVSPAELALVGDLDAMGVAIKAALVLRVRDLAYSELTHALRVLVHEAKHAADPQYNLAALQESIALVEALIE